MPNTNDEAKFVGQRGRQLLAVFGWSLAVFFIGVSVGQEPHILSSGLGITAVQAETGKSAEKSAKGQLIALKLEQFKGENLGKFAPYEPENGDLIARGHEYFYSTDGNLGLGVWESKPGTVNYENLGYDELMMVVDGSMILTGEDGVAQTFEAGQGLLLTKGWSGTLEVPEGGVRKVWVSYSSTASTSKPEASAR